MTDEPSAATTSKQAEPPTKRPNVLRRMYAWVMSWADSPYGTWALAGISFAESSFFPIPPDVLQIGLSAGRPRRSFFYAFVSSLASVLGGIAGWLIGYALWESVDQFFFSYVPGFTHAHFDHVGELYEDNAMLAIFSAAFTPIPFKVFTIAAGVFHEYVPLTTLIIASALGRSARFFLVATFMFYFGAPARAFLERYFELLTLLLLVLLVGGFVAVKFMFQ